MHSDRIYARLTIFPFDFISEGGGDLVCGGGERKSWERHAVAVEEERVLEI
jgi:hypothetical protein